MIHKAKAIDREKLEFGGTDESEANLGRARQTVF